MGRAFVCRRDASRAQAQGRIIARPVRKAFAFASLVMLGGCRPALLDPQGPVGEAQRVVLFNALAIMLAIVVPTIIATLVFAWWFRAGNARAQYRPTWAYSGRLEAIVWSIPIMIVIFLGGIAWIGSHQLDPARPLASSAEPLDIQVVSLDWKWLFLYPQQTVASVNELVIPTGRPIRFSLTSASVMNAFFVPQLGSMIYTMNGMTTRLNLQADAPGIYSGLSSHFSGDGFSDMRFDVRAMKDDAFGEWVAKAARSDGALDRARYEQLAQQSQKDPPAVLRLVDKDLFDAIVRGQIPPAPGPVEGKPDPSVSPRAER